MTHYLSSSDDGPRAVPATAAGVLHVMRMKGIAGSEGHLLELARALNYLGWRVDAVLASPHPGALCDYAANLASAGGGRVTILNNAYDVSIPLIRHIRARLSAEQQKVLHTHLVHADWHGALAAADLPEVAVVSTKHNHDPFRTGHLYKAVERLAALRSDATIAISASLAAFVHEHAGSRPNVVRYGLAAPADAPIRPARPLGRIIAVGRLEKQKGYDTLIKAFAVVARTRPGLTLSICGDGSQRRGLVALAAHLGVSDRVEFLGWRDDVEQLLVDADLFVHSARWEGFGLVLLEAMRSALPIVATRVGAIPEIVTHEVTGLIVEPEDATAFAVAIRRLADDDPLRARLGAAGFWRLQQEFSPHQMASDTAAIYARACDERLGRSSGTGQRGRRR